MKEELIKQINPLNLPTHIGIIMDGNGRWAKKRNAPRAFGHTNGIIALKEVLKSSLKLKIPYLSLYVFSQENQNRPALEVCALMELIAENLKEQLDELHKNQIRIIAIGSLKEIKLKKLKENLKIAIEKTAENKGLTLIIALNYSAKSEIISASRNIVEKIIQGSLSLKDIDERCFEDNLYTSNIPSIDLVIRSGGEKRMSNFLLWQSAYAELYFTEILWPDFREDDFFKAIIDYQNRERRFGKLEEQNNKFDLIYEKKK